MEALETVESEYIKAIEHFIHTSPFCKNYEIQSQTYLGYREGAFIFKLESQFPENSIILRLDPYDLGLVGCFEYSEIHFHIGFLPKLITCT